MRVGFLNAGATRQILENPNPDFPLEYNPDAIDEIYRLTHGQPYLVQLIGFQLVRRFNEQVFETGKQRDPMLTLADVAAVTDISQADLFRNGRYYFDGIWKQASQGTPGQTTVLQALAARPTGLSIDELQSLCPDVPDMMAALDTLQRHDVVEECGETWHIQVELCRRWIAKRSG